MMDPTRFITSLVAVILLTMCITSGEELPQPCDSTIYCYGDLLKTVQLAELYTDSKTFVDMKQKSSSNVTLQMFDTLMSSTEGKPDKDQVRKFVEEAFDETEELETYTPDDWTENPSILQKVLNPVYQEWVKELNEIWKNLTRKMSDNVREHPDQYSLIYVPNPFVVPGGRFKEFYYWDTYWIVQGLLLCDMHHTTLGILENFLSVLSQFGHIPNGGRVYYKQRSQPPMLIPMVNSYISRTNNITFLKNNIKLLEAEFDFWTKERTITVQKNGKQYTLFRYYAPSLGPRPESYREDYHHAESFKTEEEQTEFYINLKSAAESGWDFSSRWFIKDGTDEGKLVDIHTKDIIPVDLNAFLFWNAVLLSKFNTMLGKSSKSKMYRAKAEEIKAAVSAVLWNDDFGTWFDYDLINNKPRQYFYPSNLAPLWTNCYETAKTPYYAAKTVNYIKNSTITQFMGGIPTSLEKTLEQWDSPNAWPPLQVIVIQGLAYTNDPDALTLAFSLANNWIKANHKGYVQSKIMFEKYNAEIPGAYGDGGEYVVQSGFGWTNGVILELLNTYGEIMIPGTTHFNVHDVKRRKQG